MPIITSRWQLTIPRHIRDELKLQPGATVEFTLNAAGEVVLGRPRPYQSVEGRARDRFDAARGRADVRSRTDDLMRLLRAEG